MPQGPGARSRRRFRDARYNCQTLVNLGNNGGTMTRNITVNVVDKDGHPVPGCKVRAINYSAVDANRITSETTTDPQGRAEFRDLDSGILGGDRYSLIAENEVGLGLIPYLQLFRDEHQTIILTYQRVAGVFPNGGLPETIEKNSFSGRKEIARMREELKGIRAEVSDLGKQASTGFKKEASSVVRDLSRFLDKVEKRIGGTS